MPHWSYITEPFSLAVKYAPCSHFPPVQVCWGEIHRGYNKDNWPRVCHVSGTKYRWNRINNKIHHPHLICKTHFCPCLCKYSGRLLATLLRIEQIRDRHASVNPGFYDEGRGRSITRDFENYVSILDADLQNLAVFILSEIKNLTLYCSQVSVFFVSSIEVL